MEPMEMQADASPVAASETRPAPELSHIPKKKRAATHDSSDDDLEDDAPLPSPTSPKAAMAASVSDDEKLRKKAMNRLRALAEQYKMGSSVMDGWTVSISRKTTTRTKKLKKDDSSEQAVAKPVTKVTVHFVDPSGREYQSELEAVLATRKLDRGECYQKAREYASGVLAQVPVVIGDVLVKCFGEIDQRPKYHNRVSIFPVGFCCEVRAHSSALDAFVQVECSVGDGGNEGPIFSAKVLHDSLPEEVLSSKQLPQLYKKVMAALNKSEAGHEEPASKPKPKAFNIFPLDVERVIEGMEGSIACADYQFHEERGFGVTYVTEEEAEKVKSRLLRGYSGEKRQRQRDSLAGAVGQTRQAAEKKQVQKHKKQQSDKTERKSVGQEETSQKMPPKEPKKRKLDEETKQQRAEERAAHRAKVQEARRLQKEWEKKIQPIRRAIKTESRKRRQFARSAVLRIYDTEYDVVFQHNQAIDQNSVNSDDLAALFATQAQAAASVFGLTETELDATIDICSCLSTFSNLLKLRETPTLRGLVTALATVSTPTPTSTVKSTHPVEEERELEDNTNTPDSQLRSSMLMLDNIHIRLTKILSQELHRVLGLLEVGEDKRSGPLSRHYHYRLPINQLTWQELGRQCLLLGLTHLLELSEEDITHTIRGKPHHRGRDRSTIRLLKYRTAYRFCSPANDNSSPATHANGGCTDVHPLPSLTDDDAQDVQALDLEFDSEEEMVAQLQEFVDDGSHTENYRRCGKILIRLIQHSASKNFVWEVDKSQFPKYYEMIRQPLMLIHVVKKLLLERYGSDESETPRLFYADLQRVCANSIVYNTEQSNFWNQADKLVAIADRLIFAWVLADTRRPVESLSDDLCMISGRQPLQGEKFLKCGRCAGSYALEEVRPVPPATIIHSTTEEWFCEFCGDVSFKWHTAQIPPAHIPPTWRDAPFGFGPVVDGPEVASTLQPTSLDALFRFGAWGPSANLPWTLNLAINRQADEAFEMDEDAASMLAGLAVLSGPKRGSLCSSEPWTVREHITVLKALCILLRLSSDAEKYLRSLEKKCQKLMDLASSADAREADFVRALREVAGDEGVQLWKTVAHDFDLLSGAQADGVSGEALAGRCIVCKRSTSEDEEHEVLLCDACDAEAHLACVGVKQVPSEAWYCDSCRVRRKTDGDNDMKASDADEVKRRIYLEEALVSDAVQRVLKETNVESAAHKDPFCFGDFTFHLRPDVLCAYCNLSEKDLCSPFVVGQAASEAMACADVMKSADSESHQQPDGTPYFPLFCDSEIHSIDGPVVHEFCAAMMEQARRQKLKHKARRARQLVAEETIMLSGVNTQPLGQDREGRLYWRFPMQQDSVFVCTPTHQFTGSSLLPGNTIEDATNHSSNGWHIFRGATELEMLTKTLRQDNPREWILQQRIIRLFLRSSPSAAPETEVQVGAEAKDDPETANGVEEHADDRLQIQLITGVPQSVAILSEVFIDVDDAAEEEDDEEDYDENQDISHTQYFTFSSRLYFAVALCQNGKPEPVDTESFKMTYEIRREQQIIATVTADTPWSDGVYYFASLMFRRAGKYTLSFFVEGAQAKNIAPLCFVVNVRVRTVRVGQEAALAQLEANRRQPSSVASNLKVDSAVAEVDVVRAAILTVQSALPLSAYAIVEEQSFPRSEQFLPIAEAHNWSKEFEQTWLHLVTTATTPDALMEALLLLEAFLDEKSLDGAWKRAAQALPAPSYALRNATCHSVALRLFVLDSVLEYSRHTGSRSSMRTRRAAAQIHKEPRLVDDSYYETRSSRRQRDHVALAEPAHKGRKTRNSRATEMGVSRQRIATSDDDDDDDDDSDGGYGSRFGSRRSTRSSRNRNHARPNYNEDFDDDFEDEERSERPSRSRRAQQGHSSSEDDRDDDDDDGGDDDDQGHEDEDEGDNEDIDFTAANWLCERCGLSNMADNLRCSGCDQRKPVASSSSRSEVAMDIQPSRIDFDAKIRQLDPSNDEAIRFLSILRRLAELPSSGPFWNSTDPGKSLRSVTDGVIAGFYGSSTEMFGEAVRKILLHAQETNPAGSSVVIDSCRVSAVFERLWAAWVVSEDRPVSPDLRDLSCPNCGRADGFGADQQTPNNDQGSIICDQCEGCYHLRCAGLQELPAGNWFCRDCTTQGLTR